MDFTYAKRPAVLPQVLALSRRDERRRCVVGAPRYGAADRCAANCSGKRSSPRSAAAAQHQRGGLRTALDNPDTGRHEDVFDLMGNRVRSISPSHAVLGTSIVFEYDRNRLASINYPSKPDVKLTYGAPGAPNGGAGRLLSRHDETGTIHYSYGALGEIRQTHRVLDGLGIPVDDVTHGFTYDSLGRQLQMTYPDGEVVTNTYDAAGALTGVAGDETYASGIRYDVFGNRTRMTVGNVTTIVRLSMVPAPGANSPQLRNAWAVRPSPR